MRIAHAKHAVRTPGRPVAVLLALAVIGITAGAAPARTTQHAAVLAVPKPVKAAKLDSALARVAGSAQLGRRPRSAQGARTLGLEVRGSRIEVQVDARDATAAAAAIRAAGGTSSPATGTCSTQRPRRRAAPARRRTRRSLGRAAVPSTGRSRARRGGRERPAPTAGSRAAPAARACEWPSSTSASSAGRRSRPPASCPRRDDRRLLRAGQLRGAPSTAPRSPRSCTTWRPAPRSPSSASTRWPASARRRTTSSPRASRSSTTRSAGSTRAAATARARPRRLTGSSRTRAPTACSGSTRPATRAEALVGHVHRRGRERLARLRAGRHLREARRGQQLLPGQGPAGLRLPQVGRLARVGAGLRPLHLPRVAGEPERPAGGQAEARRELHEPAVGHAVADRVGLLHEPEQRAEGLRRRDPPRQRDDATPRFDLFTTVGPLQYNDRVREPARARGVAARARRRRGLLVQREPRAVLVAGTDDRRPHQARHHGAGRRVDCDAASAPAFSSASGGSASTARRPARRTWPARQRCSSRRIPTWNPSELQLELESSAIDVREPGQGQRDGQRAAVARHGAALAARAAVAGAAGRRARDHRDRAAGQDAHRHAGELDRSGDRPYKYQWQRCTARGVACADLAGAFDATYQPVAADVGSALRVVVTAVNTGGSSSSTSPPTAAVLPAAPGEHGAAGARRLRPRGLGADDLARRAGTAAAR